MALLHMQETMMFFLTNVQLVENGCLSPQNFMYTNNNHKFALSKDTRVLCSLAELYVVEQTCLEVVCMYASVPFLFILQDLII